MNIVVAIYTMKKRSSTLSKDKTAPHKILYLPPSILPSELQYNQLSLPSVRNCHCGCARCGHCICMIGIRLPSNGTVACNIDIFVLNHLSSSESDRHIPEVVA